MRQSRTASFVNLLAGLASIVGLLLVVVPLLSDAGLAREDVVRAALVVNVPLGVVGSGAIAFVLPRRHRRRHGNEMLTVCLSWQAALALCGVASATGMAAGLVTLLVVTVNVVHALVLRRMWRRYRYDREQQCPFCMEWVHLRAIRCRHCTSRLAGQPSTS